MGSHMKISLMLVFAAFTLSTDSAAKDSGTPSVHVPYVDAVKSLPSLPTRDKIDGQKNALTLSWVGRYSESETAYSTVMATNKISHSLVSDAQMEKLSAVDGIAAVVDEASKRRLVIINETHNSSLHRAFVQKLLPQLYRLGYRYFAGETFSQDIHAVVTDREVPFSAGPYLADPIYAELVREAKAAGWTLMPYEASVNDVTDRASRMAARERRQAENLAKVFEADPDAKIVVLAGLGHAHRVSTQTSSGHFKSMSSNLADMSRLDPLVVDQVVLSGLAEDQNGLRAKLLKRFPKIRNSPITLVNEKGDYFTVGVFPKSVDIMIIHPVYSVKDGRPSWLTSLAGRQPLSPPNVGKPIPSDTLFLAKRQGVKKESVPVDAILVRAGELVPVLMVPLGKFEVEAVGF
jgi:hypothetical protein